MGSVKPIGRSRLGAQPSRLPSKAPPGAFPSTSDPRSDGSWVIGQDLPRCRVEDADDPVNAEAAELAPEVAPTAQVPGMSAALADPQKTDRSRRGLRSGRAVDQTEATGRSSSGAPGRILRAHSRDPGHVGRLLNREPRCSCEKFHLAVGGVALAGIGRRCIKRANLGELHAVKDRNRAHSPLSFSALHQVPDCERVTRSRKSRRVVENAPSLDTIRGFGHELIRETGEHLRAIRRIVDPWRPMQAVVGQAAPAARLTGSPELVRDPPLPVRSGVQPRASPPRA